ncbi:MAG: thioredoxin domain-containing protein [Patescibacteria group bacterium]|jgi:protein-disulfide isomerase
MQMDKQTVMKKVGTIVAWAVGIVAVLGFLVLVAKMQDSTQVGSPLANDILPTDHVTGKLDSAVTLVEYSDFQCPACGAYAPLVEKLMVDYSDKVRFVFRHFPIYSKHPNAEIAARASEAAGKQGQFFQYAQLLFAKQSDWVDQPDPRETLKGYAKSLSLNVDDFEKYMNSNESKTTVTKDYQGGVRAGINGTPTFFLNGKTIDNPNGYPAFKKLLDDALTTATPAEQAPATPPVDTTTQK